MNRLTIKIIVFFFLICGIIISQHLSNLQKTKTPKTDRRVSPDFIKALDLGLHTVVATNVWFDVRTEVPFIKNKSDYERFAQGFEFINKLDPKFSLPYYYSVLVLPTTKYEGSVDAAIEIGERGMEFATPNWKIPFYLAATYHIYRDDRENAAKYFDLAASMPGMPEIVRRYAMNYGIMPKVRDKTIQVWKAIHESTESELMKEKALKYIEHFELLNLLDDAIALYKKQFGSYPEKLDDLVDKKILRAIPRSPFGFEFDIYEGGLAGIKKIEE